MESLDSGHPTVKQKTASRVSVKARTLAHESYCGVLGWLQPVAREPDSGRRRLRRPRRLMSEIAARGRASSLDAPSQLRGKLPCIAAVTVTSHVALSRGAFSRTVGLGRRTEAAARCRRRALPFKIRLDPGHILVAT